MRRLLPTALAATLALIASPVRAAVFEAGSAAELIAALDLANATPEVDVVALTGDIELTAVDNVTDGPNGLPSLTTPVVIRGNGFSIARSPLAPAFRLFRLVGGFFGNGALTLDGTTLRGGDVSSVAGDCFLILDACGGAILTTSGAVTIRNATTFVGNAAYGGGALFNASGQVEIADAAFRANSATFGAALYHAFGALAVRSSRFEDNVAVLAGGAILNAASLTVSDSEFRSNAVTDVALFGNGGGALYNHTFGGAADVANSRFTGNSAVRGGALSNFNASDLTLRNSEVRDNFNTGFGSGGGIWSDNNTSLVVRDSHIVGNRTDSAGFGDGGGIYSGQNNSLVLESSSVTDNTANRSGGGIYMSSTNAAVVSRIANSRIDGNTASGDGGGIYKEGASPLTIVASSISDNVNEGFNGGGLAIEGGAVVAPEGVRIVDSTIARNRMVTGDGGGISNESQGVLVVEGSTIAGNVVTGVGGVSGLGGGIFSNRTNSSVTVRNSTIDANDAQSNGGGIYNNNASTLTIDQSTVTGNVAGLQGGGIHALATIAVTDSIIADNVANHPVDPPQPNCGGLGIFIADGGGNYTDDRAPECPAGFVESASLAIGPLTDNGGPTATRALLPGSAAIDGGSVCGLADDQRGVPRDALCDSGAYEAGAILPVVRFESAASSVDEVPGGIHDVLVTLDNTAGTIASADLDVYVAITGTAAQAGRDFDLATALPVSFSGASWPAPGSQATQAVSLDVLPDFLLEGAETVQLDLRDAGLSGPADLVGTDRHVVTIDDAQADLAVAKSVALTGDQGTIGVVEPGDEVTYTVTLTNVGPFGAEDVTLEDVVDGASLDLATASVSTTLGVYDLATSEWSQDGAGSGLGFDLLPGQSETLTIAATVLPDVSGPVENTASLSAAFPPRAADPDASNDAATVAFGACEVTPPTLAVTVSPAELWPPSHELVAVTADVVASDDSLEPPSVTLLSVVSNEPDDGLGDGHTSDDIVVVDERSFLLRAERSGRGEGRTYTILYEASDACGNAVRQAATVTVPKDRRK